MRTLGSCTSSPRSCTWPSTWPLPFCERALPRWVPRPKNAVADSRIDQRSTGRPRSSRKPRPLSTSSRTRALSLGPSVGSGKSRQVTAAISASRAASALAAVSTSAISTGDSGISQSSRLAISGPYQAAALFCSGGSSNDISLESPLSSLPGKARREEIVAGRQPEALGGVDQRRPDAGFQRAVAGVRNHDVARFGPGPRQGIGGDGWADDVVAALDDGRGQRTDAAEIRPRPAFGHERAVGKVMCLDAREREREAAVIRLERRPHRRIKRRAGRLVAAPGTRRRTVAVGVAISETAIVVAQKIGALGLRQVFDEVAPRFGKNGAHAVEKPVDLGSGAEKDSAKDEARHPVGVLDPVGQRQRAAP